MPWFSDGGNTPNGWTSEPLGAGFTNIRVLSRNGRAFHAVHTDADAGDVDASDFINLTAKENLISLDSDIATTSTAGEPGGGGLFTCDVKLIVNDGQQLLSAIIVTSLSDATPAVFDLPPGKYIVVCTTDADTTGELMVQGRGH